MEVLPEQFILSLPEEYLMIKKGIIIAFVFIGMGVAVMMAKDVVEEIVAIVNEDIITLSRYKEQHDLLYQMLRSQLEGEEFEKQYTAARKEILDSMITDLLLLQLAKEKGVNVNEQVKMTIENIKKENNIESDEVLKREMERQGIVFEQWVKQMEENFQKQAVVFSEVDRSIVIDDSEIVNYYKLHPGEFTDPVEYKLRAIYLSYDEGMSEEEVETKKKEISEKIRTGEDLAALASVYSEGPGKETQGDLGSFRKGQLESTLEQAVEKLKPGEISPWLKTRNGWYLLRLEEKKESRLKPFEEVKKEVEEKLFQERKQKKLDEFLKTLREKSYIKILRPNPLNF